MSWLSFKPFGRGSDTSVSNNIQTPYDSLKGYSAASFGLRLFHPNAQVHEDFISWNTHNHEDGSLAIGSLRDVHFNKTKTSADHSRVLFTHTPKTLFLFGEKEIPYGIKVDDDHLEYSYYVDFATSSYFKQSFLQGTVPLVFASLKFVSDTGHPGTEPYSYHVTSISSSGFTLTILFMEDDLDTTLYDDMSITYLAVGVAPGALVAPGE